MNFIQDSIRGNYLMGVNNLIGSSMVNDRMRRCVLDANCQEARLMPEMYYLLTRELIEKMSSEECKLSDNLKKALSEAIGIKLWEDFSGDYKANDSIMPENYVQRFFGEILMNNIGERETAVMALKDPDLFGEFLDSIPYEQETFLSYINHNLDEADKQQIVMGRDRKSVGNYGYMLDCINAVFDCGRQLRIPAKRMDKVLSMKKKGKSNEREHE